MMCFPLFPLFLSVPGIFLGMKGKSDATRTGAGAGLSIAGIITCSLVTLLAILWLAFFIIGIMTGEPASTTGGPGGSTSTY